MSPVNQQAKRGSSDSGRGGIVFCTAFFLFVSLFVKALIRTIIILYVLMYTYTRNSDKDQFPYNSSYIIIQTFYC